VEVSFGFASGVGPWNAVPSYRHFEHSQFVEHIFTPIHKVDTLIRRGKWQKFMDSKELFTPR
jgi:hypothetical protein